MPSRWRSRIRARSNSALCGAPLAQYERALIQERVVASLAAARRRGRIGGRPKAITGEKLDAIIAALDGSMSKAAVCRNFGVKRTTLIETLARTGWSSPSSPQN
jgi:DNA invertase Pin-like site-specific DNA recombinase